MKQKIWSQQCLQANTRPRITGRVKIWRSIDSCLDNYFHHIPRILIVCGSGLANCHSPPPTWSTGPILPFSINRNVFNYLQIHAVIPGKKGTQAVQIPHSWAQAGPGPQPTNRDASPKKLMTGWARGFQNPALVRFSLNWSVAMPYCRLNALAINSHCKG